jgi:hypothetical protein
MSPSRPLRAPASLAALVLALALACGGQEERGNAQAPATPDSAPPAEAPASVEDPTAPAATPSAPSGPVVSRTLTHDGEIFEAEYGKADQLPSDFPDDVPLYANARPLSSMASRDHGTVVNLRSADPPAAVYAWYREHYAAQGWEIEQAREDRARSTLVARKGNRVSSIVITSVPGATQALLLVAEDR